MTASIQKLSVELGCYFRCFLLLTVCLASLRCVHASRGMCMYASLDRSGGRWRIPERCTHLYLTQINFGSVGARQMGQALSANPPVTRVDSSSCQIKGFSGAAALGDSLKVNTILQQWDLGNNALGDNGAEAIAQGLAVNTALRWLNLAHNRIGPAGAQALASALRQNKVLTSLNLDSNRIHDDGLEHLANMLRENSVLETLILSGNQINNEGAAILAEALPHNQGLKTLHIKYNRISAEGARRLAEAVVNRGRLTVIGPIPLEYGIARYKLKQEAWASKNATLMMEVARMYEDGVRGAEKLTDRFIQAYCWCVPLISGHHVCLSCETARWYLLP
jgi:Leucine Rich repeat